MKRLLAKLSLNSLALSLITRLVEQCEHILLVSLHTWLIECVDTQHTTTDAASLLKEINQLTQVILIKLRHAHTHVRHTTINMGQLCTQFSHLVDLVNTFASQEVQSIKVLLVGRHFHLVVRSLDADNRLVDGALALLNPLAHRVKVGSEVNRSWEYTLVILAL